MLLGVAAACAAAEPGAAMEEYLAAEVEVNGFSGSVLVAHNGQVLLRRGYGMANIEHDVPNTPQTKFRLGSVTKQFTAMAIVLLAEQGKLSVNDVPWTSQAGEAVCRLTMAPGSLQVLFGARRGHRRPRVGTETGFGRVSCCQSWSHRRVAGGDLLARAGTHA